MKITGIGFVVLGAASLLFVIAPYVSAQTIPEMLNGQWFQVNGSFKGYPNYVTEEIAGKLSDKWKGYIYTTFDSGTNMFTMTTCTPNPDGISYTPSTIEPFSIMYVWGASHHKQIWNFSEYYRFSGSFLAFGDFHIFPFLIMDIKLDTSDAFKSASFKTEGCVAYYTGPFAAGSCTLQGKTVPMEKVPAGARFACIP
jgi:hypothetical protein